MFKAIADGYRLARAGAVMASHDVVMPADLRVRAPWPARFAGAFFRFFSGSANSKKRPGQRFASALEKLGPAWIKLGQFLATRPDVIGMQAATDLSRLKDAVPPFSRKLAEATLRSEFSDDAEKLFPDLGPPVAAASIAQVHRIETPQGPRAVKILRPNIEREIELELRAMRRAASIAQKSRNPEIQRMEPLAFVDTMARSMSREMDLRLEAAAAHEFAEIAAIDNYVFVPEVDWERTTRRVLTTQWIDGKSLTDPAAL